MWHLLFQVQLIQNYTYPTDKLSRVIFFFNKSTFPTYWWWTRVQSPVVQFEMDAIYCMDKCYSMETNSGIQASLQQWNMLMMRCKAPVIHFRIGLLYIMKNMCINQQHHPLCNLFLQIKARKGSMFLLYLFEYICTRTILLYSQCICRCVPCKKRFWSRLLWWNLERVKVTKRARIKHVCTGIFHLDRYIYSQQLSLGLLSFSYYMNRSMCMQSD